MVFAGLGLSECGSSRLLWLQFGNIFSFAKHKGILYLKSVAHFDHVLGFYAFYIELIFFFLAFHGFV